MEEYETPVSQSTSLARFAIVGIILAILLLAGLYFGKQSIDAMQKPAEVAKTPEKKQTKNPDTTKKVATKPEDKKKQETPTQPKKETPKPAPSTSTDASSSSTPNANATTRPSSTPVNTAPASPNGAIASTGPEDTLFAVVIAAVLGYGGFNFLRSRSELSKAIKQSTET